MNFIKKIRIRIGAFFLKQKIKNIKRTPVACNLRQAKDVGIIFNSTIEKDRQTVRKLESFLKSSDIKTEVLGFSDQKRNADILIGDPNHHYLNTKDFNWLYIPKNQEIIHFCQSPYDILINLYQEPQFEIDYIIKLSMAKFKVGCAHLDKGLHDLMIEVGDKKGDSDFLTDQIKHYLNILNN